MFLDAKKPLQRVFPAEALVIGDEVLFDAFELATALGAEHDGDVFFIHHRLYSQVNALISFIFLATRTVGTFVRQLLHNPLLRCGFSATSCHGRSSSVATRDLVETIFKIGSSEILIRNVF